MLRAREIFGDKLSSTLKRGQVSLLPSDGDNTGSEEKEVSARRERIDQILKNPEILIEKSLSEFAEDLVCINRQTPLDFGGRKYLRWVYDVHPKHAAGSRNIILIAGRQVEKSTTLSAKAATLGAVYPNFDTLIVHPRFDQVKVFSQQRFRPMVEDSEAFRRLWLSTKCVWQVGSREFKNRSFFNFKSCYYSADPSRGITANFLEIDEIQDIISDNIPVLEECQSHIEPEMRYNLYAGTPKTTSNTLNLRWKESCQFEWMVRCQSCTNWNFLDDKVIGKTAYICSRCGRPIFPQIHGQWVAMRPSKIDECWGFRISQIMVPFMRHADVIKKMEDPNISRRVFFNECLGLPYDEGELVLTEADMRAACENDRPSDTPKIAVNRHDMFIVAGLDHGTGGYAAIDMRTGQMRQSVKRRTRASYTVLAIAGFCPDQKFRILKLIKFKGEAANLARQPGLINDLIREWGIKWIMSDEGFGAQTNQRLVSDFGWTYVEAPGSPLLLRCLYVPAKKPVKFDPSTFCYHVNRNWAIEATVDSIKKGEMRFFRENEMEEFIDDFTTIYVEYDDAMNRMKYDHILPDDCFHAVLYAYLAGRQRIGRLAPTLIPNTMFD